MAIIDRLLHHGDVFYLRGASYRLRGKEPVVLATTTVAPVVDEGARMAAGVGDQGDRVRE
jgi:hypothetical protein